MVGLNVPMAPAVLANISGIESVPVPVVADSAAQPLAGKRTRSVPKLAETQTVRISIGLEDIADLTDDLLGALAATRIANAAVGGSRLRCRSCASHHGMYQ